MLPSVTNTNKKSNFITNGENKIFKYSLGSIFSTNLRMATVRRSISHDQIYEQQQLSA
jgi:hypothetical protein